MSGPIMWNEAIKGEGKAQRQTAPSYVNLFRQEDPEGYIADPDLTMAANVAILLGQPLLLTGEPGIGKSFLAHRVAYEFGQGKRSLVFVARATSVASELFYTYDALRRFLDVQNREERARDPRNYVTYQALGLAILLALPLQMRRRFQPFLPEQYWDRPPQRMVVLVDEIDKAPRDLPNDILNEVERMEFLVKETGESVPDFEGEERRLRQQGWTANDAESMVKGYRETFYQNRPILILTSNDEKRLPDAFLRRCVYHNITFPDPATPEGQERLREIVRRRLSGEKLPSPHTGEDYLQDSYLNEALKLFAELRKKLRDKKPATAELIAWVRMLAQQEVTREELIALNQKSNLVIQTQVVEKLKDTLGVLAKTEPDRKDMSRHLESLLSPSSEKREEAANDGRSRS